MDTRSYLISRTLMPPRELIQLCNLCRDTAVKNGNPTITENDILEAEVLYSSWKLQDLVGEYRVNYPFLADLLVIFQSSGYLITRPALEQRLGRVADALAARYPPFSSVFNVHDTVDLLYGIGFLGVLRNGISHFSYEDPVQLQPDDAGFVIQPSFRQALRSTSSLDVRPYDSQWDEASQRFLSHWYSGIRSGRRFGRELDVRSGVFALKELISMVGRLEWQVRELSFSEELKRDLSATLRTIYYDLDKWHDRADTATLFRIVDEMARAFHQMANQLRQLSEVEKFSSGQALAREFELAADRAREAVYQY